MTKRFELRLCSNGTYYVYENGTLTDVDFDKFNKESAYALIDKVNALYNENEKLKIFLKALNEELSLANRDNDTLEEENEQLKQDLKDCKKLAGKRLNKIRNHRAVIEDLGGSIRAYKGQISQLNEKIEKIQEAMDDVGALTKRQLEEILND